MAPNQVIGLVGMGVVIGLFAGWYVFGCRRWKSDEPTLSQILRAGGKAERDAARGAGGRE